jgi:hypothetical protein
VNDSSIEVGSLAHTKQALRQAIGQSRADGTYEDGQYAEVLRLINELAARTPMQRPIDEQATVAGPWRATFAQFGPRHTAGKPVVHVNKLNLLTFARMPERAVRVLAIEQEIHHVSYDYNNVHYLETTDGSLRARMTVYGRYRIEPAEPKRYLVEFYRVAFMPDAEADEAAIRRGFDLPPEQPLSVDLKPPKLSSDVVYCDADLRINFGSVGGIYVMDRVHHAGHSVSFA